MKSWMIGKTSIRIHNMAWLCYSVSKVNIIEVIEIPSFLEVLPIVLEIEKETILLVIAYHIPGPLGSSIDNFILLINELPTQHRMFIAGDFNRNQMLPEHVVKILTCLSVDNIQLIYMGEYWIWYLMVQILILFLLCRHPTVITLFFFFKFDGLYLYKIYNLHYITHKYLC